MHPAPEHALVTPTAEFIACDLGDDTVILNLADGTYYGLNPVGARIWELLQQQPRTIAELRIAVRREFGVAPERCATDLETFLAQLQARALVTVADASHS